MRYQALSEALRARAAELHDARLEILRLKANLARYEHIAKVPVAAIARQVWLEAYKKDSMGFSALDYFCAFYSRNAPK